MEVSEFYSTVEALHSEARSRNLYFQASEDERLEGRSIKLLGRDMTSFGSCSYLGLEFHPAIKEGVIDFVERYGTQFSYSRAFIASPRYRETEEHLSQIFGGASVMIGSSTSLGHQSVLPAIATERDAIVLDNQAHHSIQKAATLAQAGGAKMEIVRHFELDEHAVDTVARLARKHRTVYFCIDGVYSMYGDTAPIELVQQILDVAPNVRLYVDDAHGMSWAGKNGRGWFLSQMPLNERIVFTTSLNKAYSAAGGVFVFSDPEECEAVRMRGGPYAFSGPPQPPMLGAILASAKVHLSDEITELQKVYAERAELMNEQMAEYNLPLLSRNEGPIFFLRMGRAEAAYALAERMYEEGYYVNTSTYPMVPLKRAGMRITVTALHTPDQIRGVCQALAHHLPAVLEENGVQTAELDRLFERAIPSESWGGIDLKRSHVVVETKHTKRIPDGMDVQVHSSIEALDPVEWDRWMTGHGASSWEALQMAERAFRGHADRAHNREWRYLVVRDGSGAVVGATYCTKCVVKDDMWMRPEVTALAEERRKDDPYFLSSETLLMGSALSEGDHLHVAAGADRPTVLAAVVGTLEEIAEEWGVEKIVLRDFAADDEDLENWMHRRDWVKIPIMDNYRILDVGETEEEMISQRVDAATRSGRAEKFFRGLTANAVDYFPRIYGANGRELLPEWVPHLFELYSNVEARAKRIKDFGFPQQLIAELLTCPAWDVVGLHRQDDPDGPPVAWYAAHRGGKDYAAFFCGVDYAHVKGDYGAYRQLLLLATRRAREVGAKTVHLGYDAGMEKKRFGAEPEATCVYARSQNHDSGERMLELVTQLGLANSDAELVS